MCSEIGPGRCDKDQPKVDFFLSVKRSKVISKHKENFEWGGGECVWLFDLQR